MPLRLGRAFMELLERYPADKIPDAGGVAATLVVTLDLATLVTGLKPAHLDTGELVSGAEARRLACEAGIIPVVLGGKSQILDVGRTARFHTKPQRVAMHLRDGGCTVADCDWPPGMCHAHHEIAWSEGGGTSVENGRTLCPRHHAYAHDPRYSMTALPTGKVTFHRRT